MAGPSLAKGRPGLLAPPIPAGAGPLITTLRCAAMMNLQWTFCGTRIIWERAYNHKQSSIRLLLHCASFVAFVALSLSLSVCVCLSATMGRIIRGKFCACYTAFCVGLCVLLSLITYDTVPTNCHLLSEWCHVMSLCTSCGWELNVGFCEMWFVCVVCVVCVVLLCCIVCTLKFFKIQFVLCCWGISCGVWCICTYMDS